MVWLVSVMNAALLDFSFFCSCSTSRTCLCASLERNVNRQCTFLHTRGKRILSRKLCHPEKGDTAEERSHIALVENRTF